MAAIRNPWSWSPVWPPHQSTPGEARLPRAAGAEGPDHPLPYGMIGTGQVAWPPTQ